MKRYQKLFGIISLIAVLTFGSYAIYLAVRGTETDPAICSLSAVDCPGEQDASGNQKTSEKSILELTEALDSRERLVVATCYTETGNKTYSGKWPEAGMIAVRFASPRVGDLKMGQRVWLEGAGLEGVYVVEDRLPDYHAGRDIDVYFEGSEEECLSWGKNNLRMEIL